MFITLPKVFASMGVGYGDWNLFLCIGTSCSTDKCSLSDGDKRIYIPG